jgi:hypothetical protein
VEVGVVNVSYFYEEAKVVVESMRGWTVMTKPAECRADTRAVPTPENL